MKGKWAQGIRPRRFAWVLKDRLAVCERPGGCGENHRRVRRLEEIIWIRENGFDLVVSLIPAPHNLHNYDELGVRWLHHPFTGHDDERQAQLGLYRRLAELLAEQKQILVHGDELGDLVGGLVGGYLRWSGLVPDTPQAVVVWEQLTRRPLGPTGRRLVSLAARLPGPGVSTSEQPDPAPTRAETPGSG